jgi:hypothetical protein
MAPPTKRPSAKTRAKRGSKPAKALKDRAARARTAKPRDAACDRFVEDLLARGEAVKPDRSGKLPPGATHVVQKAGRDGIAAVKRVRFKLV